MGFDNELMTGRGSEIVVSTTNRDSARRNSESRTVGARLLRLASFRLAPKGKAKAKG